MPRPKEALGPRLRRCRPLETTRTRRRKRSIACKTCLRRSAPCRSVAPGAQLLRSSEAAESREAQGGLCILSAAAKTWAQVPAAETSRPHPPNRTPRAGRGVLGGGGAVHLATQKPGALNCDSCSPSHVHQADARREMALAYDRNRHNLNCCLVDQGFLPFVHHLTFPAKACCLH